MDNQHCFACGGSGCIACDYSDSEEQPKNKILPFRSSYSAVLRRVFASGLVFEAAGTLDGFIDVAVSESDGSHRTYNITCREAAELIRVLSLVIKDVRKNCRYELDALLLK